MSSIQSLSKVTREMTNSRCVRLPLNMSASDETVDRFQEGIAMVTECVFILVLSAGRVLLPFAEPHWRRRD